MRVIKSAEEQHTCKKCKSVIAMRPDEINHVSGKAWYDSESDDQEGSYWDCPVCKYRNWFPKYDDFDYI